MNKLNECLEWTRLIRWKVGNYEAYEKQEHELKRSLVVGNLVSTLLLLYHNEGLQHN